ncbi:MAG: phosphoribosylanthranilate isomerase [Burkholderiaceae bacterium]|jgi:phosphoribosylanthranilate isomerase|nr:phosphoribosylanthranilate isomerase [Burkholderiaceae bacterium]MEB2318520.1 phosphoribosylanthranilate isomerase [Pseudomonadota bacterium]
MRTRIKFCGLVRAMDVDAAVSLGADLVGFVFYARSPRVVDVQTAAALRARLPSYVGAVGLFVNEVPARVAQIGEAVGLDLLQFHGDESPQLCADAARRAGLPWWRALRVGDGAGLLESLASHGDAEAVLLDADSKAYGGSGESFDWSRVPTGHGRPIVLAGGLTPETVGGGIERLGPMAVDVSSGIQGDDPRTKDAAKMARFVAAVMQADARRAAG